MMPQPWSDLPVVAYVSSEEVSAAGHLCMFDIAGPVVNPEDTDSSRPGDATVFGTHETFGCQTGLALPTRLAGLAYTVWPPASAAGGF